MIADEKAKTLSNGAEQHDMAKPWSNLACARKESSKQGSFEGLAWQGFDLSRIGVENESLG
jgi:hypothetical protein